MTNDALLLMPREIDDFHAIGCVGPFALDISPTELEAARVAARDYSSTAVNPVYRQVLGRDLHLFNQPIHDLLFRPEIKEKAIQLLGPQLVIWRSDVFAKPPGALPVPWHQAHEFKEFTEHALLEAPDGGSDDWNRFWQLTVWIALEDSTVENGCLEIIPGTHNERITWPISGDEAKRVVAETFDRGLFLDPADTIRRDPRLQELEHTKIAMEARAGEFFIFTQRVVHGSGPNASDRSRLAINARIINSDVQCYGHYLSQGYFDMLMIRIPLDRWGCMLYAGDPPQPPVNRILDNLVEAEEPQSTS